MSEQQAQSIEERLAELKAENDALRVEIQELQVDMDTIDADEWNEFVRSLGSQAANLPADTYKTFAEARGKNWKKLAMNFLEDHIRKMKENKAMTTANIKQTLEFEKILEGMK